LSFGLKALSTDHSLVKDLSKSISAVVVKTPVAYLRGIFAGLDR
jgi:hypothetical protein